MKDRIKGASDKKEALSFFQDCSDSHFYLCCVPLPVRDGGSCHGAGR